LFRIKYVPVRHGCNAPMDNSLLNRRMVWNWRTNGNANY